MTINVGVSMILTPKQLQRLLASELKLELENRITKNRVKVTKKLRVLVARAIKSSSEYQSMLGGDLQAELGVVSPRRRLQEIVNIWVSGINVNVTRLTLRGTEITGSVNITVIKGDYEDVLHIPESSYITEKGVKIEWLRWLLLEGDKFIVRNYDIGLDIKNLYSRTKLGKIMIKAGQRNPGWRVPPEFAGTAEDNFVTRALLKIQPEIEKIVMEVFK